MDAKLITDFFYGFALLVNASLFLPQAKRIFKEKTGNNTDLLTFGGFNIIQALGFINGIYNNDIALIIGQAVSFFCCLLVTVQVVFYKIKKERDIL